ncbi:hypothetical protein ANN_07716 [Periplaneta americana]|uniref:Uncharacterized protein n=1 Tax=Periplaneta americana TaxID=6978 RepID=A0ABQ8SZG1_PERAM|nr:hypothetical protein ANN_07716 [Periplaneta americana]
MVSVDLLRKMDDCKTVTISAADIDRLNKSKIKKGSRKININKWKDVYGVDLAFHGNGFHHQHLLESCLMNKIECTVHLTLPLFVINGLGFTSLAVRSESRAGRRGLRHPA